MAVVADKASSPVFSPEELVRIGQWSTLLRELLKGKGELWSAADEALFQRLQTALPETDVN
jgi:hypothetical protein